MTIEQSGAEFRDYLHPQQNFCVVNAAQGVSYGTDLAKAGRSGTGFAHIRQAVTNLGEHTTDRTHFVTIAFPFRNYEYSDDSGATWTPNSTGEYQIYDVPYATYRARYDVLWQQGWRLKVFDRFTE